MQDQDMYMSLQSPLKVSGDSCPCRVFAEHQRSDDTTSLVSA